VPKKSEGHPKGANRVSDEALSASLAAFVEAGRPGSARLAEFAAAPVSVQQAFWSAIGKRVRWDHALSRYRDLLADPDAPPPVSVRRREPRRPWWEDRWRNRAYRARRDETRGRRHEPDFERDKARLLLISAEDYVERLTGEVPSTTGFLCCPLPDHDERTPSFRVRDEFFRCWGCGAHGSIYEFAGLLWGLARQGSDFRRIHERLVEVFP